MNNRATKRRREKRSERGEVKEVWKDGRCGARRDRKQMQMIRRQTDWAKHHSAKDDSTTDDLATEKVDWSTS